MSARRPSDEPHPWEIRESELNLELLPHRESVFALSNGHIGLRGNLDEGEPHGLPGTYLNGVYETRPLPYAEAGYGFPEDGQTVVNVTNGKLIRLLVDDEPFDIRYGELLSHERVLDMRAGTLDARGDWRSPAGQEVRVRSVRLVSLTQRAVAAIQWEVEAVGDPARIVVQSELVANEPQPSPGSKDPRAAAALRAPLQCEFSAAKRRARHARPSHAGRAGSRWAPRWTTSSRGRTAPPPSRRPRRTSGASRSPPTSRTASASRSSSSSPTAGRRHAPCRRCATRSRRRSSRRATRAGSGCWRASASRSTCSGTWRTSSSRVTSRSSRRSASGSFTRMQAGARAERRAIPAKGLTGPGYDGHAFWDTETFVLPLLTYSAPHAAAAALHWRHSTLPLARERARTLNLNGATFPWRTIAGEECSAYWPAGTAAFHVSADVADAAIRYVQVTGDEDFERETGVELLVETARLWASLGHHDDGGGFRIDGVTGPDEYSAVADNNVYTNLMAQRNLRGAADAVGRHPERARELGVEDDEVAAWLRAANEVRLPYDEELGVHAQSRRVHAPRRVGLRGVPGRATRCCCTTPTSSCTASRWSSSPTSCSRCTCAATPSTPSRRRATSTTTSSARCATRRCRPARRR